MRKTKILVLTIMIVGFLCLSQVATDVFMESRNSMNEPERDFLIADELNLISTWDCNNFFHYSGPFWDFDAGDDVELVVRTRKELDLLSQQDVAEFFNSEKSLHFLRREPIAIYGFGLLIFYPLAFIHLI